jgi:micrococcal nuclease
MIKVKRTTIYGLGFLVVALTLLAYSNLQTPAGPRVTGPKLPDGYQGKATVARVVDGDTIELTSGDRVRYIGIDTPETVDPRRQVACFGKEASNKNKELVEGREITLIADVEDRDKYDRFLRYVYQGDVFVNLELVRQGYAYAYPYPPSVTHEEDFRLAQAQARSQNAGLWGSCPESDTAPHLKRSGEL